MKKLLPILMLFALFVSCSDDKNTVVEDESKDKDKILIDERLIGKWKVEYANNLYRGIFSGDKFKMYEYFGDFDGVNADTSPRAGRFSQTEVWVEFKKDSKIAYADVHTKPSLHIKAGDINCRIENNMIYTQNHQPFRYSFNENGELILERNYRLGSDDIEDPNIPAEGILYSRYSKVE